MLFSGLFKANRKGRGYAIFIDQRNIESQQRYIINWDVFLQEVKRHLPKVTEPDKLWAGTYIQIQLNTQEVRAWKAVSEQWWNREGFQLIAPDRKDIDSLLILKMSDVAAEAEQRKLRELIIVIGSGDHIYAEAIKTIRERYPKMKIHLHVLSWYDSLSGALGKAAGKGHVHVIDNLKEKLVRGYRVSRTKEALPP